MLKYTANLGKLKKHIEVSEALESIGVSVEEQDKILGIIHEQYKPE